MQVNYSNYTQLMIYYLDLHRRYFHKSYWEVLASLPLRSHDEAVLHTVNDYF